MGKKCPKCQFENPNHTKFCGNCASPLTVSDETFEAPTETLVITYPEISTGSVLSYRYEIIEEIGKGGMGKVYKSLDREINEKIALKLIRPEIASNTKIIQRFRNEMKTARKISHRNVCRMFDIGKDGDRIYITMEFVSGEDLKKSIRRMGPLTLRKTLSIAKQICHGLAEAHHLGIVHRDLKPHNIMIDKEGNTKIMDFGIALTQGARGITDSNVMIGTPQYLSPEQVEGRKADQRSDIYSLGIILFEMITGQVPFDGDTTLSIAVKHKAEMPPDPKSLNAQIPAELSNLILKCLEKDPDKRCQTANDLCSELSKIETDISTHFMAVPKDKTTVVASISRSREFLWFGIVSLLILLLLTDYFFLHVVLNRESEISGKKGSMAKMNSLVVMPFRSLNPEKDQEPYSLIIADSLTISLHAFQELRILSFTSALAYQNSKLGVREIGKELNVDYVLDGTIWRSEGAIQINSQLSDVTDGSIYWADTFTKSLDKADELQIEITTAVANALGIQRANLRMAAITDKIRSELLTNEFYTRGRHFQIRYSNTRNERDFINCVENYLKVVESNPDDAMTYWRLGIVHERRYVLTNDRAYLDLMFQYLQKSYEMDPDFAEANLGLGWSYFYQENNKQAYDFFKRAYELDPGNAEVNFHLGSFFFSLGLYELALDFYSKAIEIDPIPLRLPLWYNLCATCYSYLGRYSEAAEIIKKALGMQVHPDLCLNYARQLIVLQMYDQAETQLSRAERLSANSRETKQLQAWLLAAQGKKSEALALIGDEDDYGYVMTNIYCLLGMGKKAIENIKLGIEHSFRERHAYYYSYPYLINNHYFNALRDYMDFLEILKKEKAINEDKIEKFGEI